MSENETDKNKIPIIKEGGKCRKESKQLLKRVKSKQNEILKKKKTFKNSFKDSQPTRGNAGSQ